MRLLNRQVAIVALLFLSAGAALATASPTTGIYDENTIQVNTVDFDAIGSAFTASQFAVDIASAFANDRGGVIDGTVAMTHEFGVNQTKSLDLNLIDGTNIGTGVPNGSPTAISGTAAFASTPDGGFNYTAFGFTNILNADPDEHVIALGVTTLSLNNRDYGNVTATGLLASGGSVSAVRHMFEPAAQGDTFFGLRAPANDYFTGFTLRYDGAVGGDNRLWFDDIGFITDIVSVPEPASVLFLSIGALPMLGRRR
ncbi:MAG: hypothetical protein H6819_08240, partial [Phycisphaerales bacterium]|nr:hypothetical protein [Phycisphaerales bacterium]